MQVSIYEALKFAGARLFHHESDLYVKVDPLSRRVVREALDDKIILKAPTLFEGADGSGLYYEFPFSYDPYWERRLKQPVSA